MHSLLFYSPIAIILTLLSGSIPLWGRWKEDHLHDFVSVSAGVLLTTAFLHLLPDAVERSTPHIVGVGILCSFVLLFILEKFIMLHPCEESHCDYHTLGIAAFTGMIIHTFFDGLALGASLLVEGGLANVVFFAIMAHKIPSAFALGSILKKAKWPKARILLFLTFFASVIPLGALCSSNLLSPGNEKGTGLALALSLGTFIYISTSDFLPEVHRAHSNRIRSLIGFLGGIALMVLLSLFVPE